MSSKIPTRRFFFEWKGHPLDDMATLHEIILAHEPTKPIIYLAGDSSLDNKYWVPSSTGPSSTPLPVAPPEIYNLAFNPPTPKPDVAFWLNHTLGQQAWTLNLSVEESMLRDRDTSLLPHDQFIRDHIRSNDVLIVSVGANDIALRPTLATARNMLKLAWFTPSALLQRPQAVGWGLGYFTSLFKERTEAYLAALVAKQKPRAIIVCMIYYPLEASKVPDGETSWADWPLRALGYNWFPAQLQAAIRAMYARATSRIRVEGTEVIPCPLYEVLDGKVGADYVARVEPSSEGGRKMAVKFGELLAGKLG